MVHHTGIELIERLHTKLQHNRDTFQEKFPELPIKSLDWKPDPESWNLTEIIGHMNETHDYYVPRIQNVLENSPIPSTGDNRYKPTFFGRIYIYFAFNTSFEFKAPSVLNPQSRDSVNEISRWHSRIDLLSHLLEKASTLSLTANRIPIEKGVTFNLGDCFRILVSHDTLHIKQGIELISLLEESIDQN